MKHLSVWLARSVASALLLCLSWIAAPAFAQDGVGDLHPELHKVLTERPERFLEDAAAVIMGHGHGGRIDAQGIEDLIALERARSRAYVLRRFLQADLDGDGSIARAEMQVLQDISSARQRGRLEVEFRQADVNEDGRVDALELTATSVNRALKAFPKGEAQMWRSLLNLDRDGDGAVGLDDVMTAIVILKGEAA